MFTRQQIASVARKASAGQGHTVRRPGHNGRYVVGGLVTRIYPVGTAPARIRADIGRMLEDKHALLASTLGSWEDDGAVYVDLGRTVQDLDHALGMARDLGELAIYDRKTGECIYLQCATPVACEDGCSCRVA